MLKWLKNLFRRKSKEPAEIVPDAVLWQTQLLQEWELLLYIDENGDKHLITNSPYDPNKNYTVLVLKHEDLEIR